MKLLFLVVSWFNTFSDSTNFYLHKFYELIAILNWAFFIVLMFKLKAVQVYMSSEYETEDKIQKELRKINIIRILWGIFITICDIN